MAGVQKILSVGWFYQEKDFFCGPAVAQMFLGFFGVTVSQPTLWRDITLNSGGSLPPDAPDTGHNFPQMVCDNCEKDPAKEADWKCWDTTPEALRHVVAARLDAALGVHYSNTFDSGVERLIESLDRTPAVPPFATLTAVNHWVLVNGYLRDDFTMPDPPETVGKYNLNGVYILDPQQRDPEERIKLVTVLAWHSDFGLVPCGHHIDTHPIVVGERRIAAWVRVGAAAVVIAILYMLLQWFAG